MIYTSVSSAVSPRMAAHSGRHAPPATATVSRSLTEQELSFFDFLWKKQTVVKQCIHNCGGLVGSPRDMLDFVRPILKTLQSVGEGFDTTQTLDQENCQIGTILPNKFMLDPSSMSKLIGKYVTKIVYVYDQAFKVGVVGNLVSTLNVGF